MSNGAQTYSFLNVNASLAGPGVAIVIGNEAGAADEGITAEPTEDTGTMVIGADGDVMHSLHAARPGQMTIRLLKTSPQNALLSQAFAFQAQSAAFWGKNALVVTDNARGDLVTLVSAAFARHGPVTWAKDANFNEWTFRGKISFLLGDGG